MNNKWQQFFEDLREDYFHHGKRSMNIQAVYSLRDGLEIDTSRGAFRIDEDGTISEL